MFLESQIEHPMQKGSIEVICGSMFSGKTEELLRRLKRAKYAKLKVKIFKPKIDTRYDKNKVVSHDDNFIDSTTVACSNDILSLAGNAEVIAIDEAQFFDKDLHLVCVKLAIKGMRVIVAGLDMDFLGNPFGPIPNLLAIAEHVTKVHAICVDCGAIANHSFRKSEDEQLVKLGEQEEYKPLCRKCFNSQ
ncbi:MAG: thymidine kinase [Flavobacteriales bacterium]|nr:thymidine kinase [Flavobacteriales bacterium]